MFKKGCFELGATIYPAVIKVNHSLLLQICIVWAFSHTCAFDVVDTTQTVLLDVT